MNLHQSNPKTNCWASAGNSTCSASPSTSVHVPSTQGKHQAVSAYVPNVKGGAGQPHQNPKTWNFQFRESLCLMAVR